MCEGPPSRFIEALIPDRNWTQECVDLMPSECGTQHEVSLTPAPEDASCVPWFPNVTDPSCTGVSLSSAVPCAGIVPVCNHGTVETPPGVRIIHFPANSAQFPRCDPDQSHPQMFECFTTEPIPPGECIDVEDCPQMTGNRAIMVNPPGPAQVAECHCGDNWSLYAAAKMGECVAPTCAEGRAVAYTQTRPIDIIFVVDNSDQMKEEIDRVEASINDEFGPLIAASGIDYRVIVISRYGDTNIAVGDSKRPICIEDPLSTATCENPSSDPLANNPPRFYHYSADIGNTDSWCKLLDSFDKSDEFTNGSVPDRPWSSLAPNGWREYLRPGALKKFVEITSSNVNCTTVDADREYVFDDQNAIDAGTQVTAEFDAALQALSPEQFVTTDGRNYIWHSILGMAPKTVVTDPWQPGEPVTTDTCLNAPLNSEGERPGTGYQALSVLTGGLRYPICYENDYSELYTDLAASVPVEAPAPCLFAAPSQGEGEYDPFDSSAAYFPGGDEDEAVVLLLVPGPSACGVSGWYWFDEANTIISLCPATCAIVQDDPAAVVRMSLGCPKEGITYGQIYEATCGPTETVHWTFLHYETDTPGDAIVQFRQGSEITYAC